MRNNKSELLSCLQTVNCCLLCLWLQQWFKCFMKTKREKLLIWNNYRILSTASKIYRVKESGHEGVIFTMAEICAESLLVWKNSSCQIASGETAVVKEFLIVKQRLQHELSGCDMSCFILSFCEISLSNNSFYMRVWSPLAMKAASSMVVSLTA